VAETLQVAEARSDRRRCPLCLDALPPQLAARECDACATAYHPTCFEELGGCGTNGCERAVSARVARIRVRARRAPAPRVIDGPAIVCGLFAGVIGLALYFVVGLNLVKSSRDPLPKPVLVGVVALTIVTFVGTLLLAHAPRAGVRRRVVSLVCGLAAASATAVVSSGLLACLLAGSRAGGAPWGLVVVASAAAFVYWARWGWRVR
jgi:hypothetical protein